jgi:Tol biopolymer transport system component
MKKAFVFGLAALGALLSVAGCGKDEDGAKTSSTGGTATGGDGGSTGGTTTGGVDDGGAVNSAGVENGGATTNGGAGNTTGAAAGSGNQAGAEGGEGGGSNGGAGPNDSTPELAVFVGRFDEDPSGIRVVDLTGIEAAGGAGGSAGVQGGLVYETTSIDHDGLFDYTHVDAVAFSPDGSRFAVAGRMSANDTTVYEFLVDGSSAPTQILEFGEVIESMKYSPDGEYLAFADDDDDLFVGTAGSASLTAESVNSATVTSYVWLPDSSGLVYVTTDSGGDLVYSELTALASPTTLVDNHVADRVEVADDGTIYYLYDPSTAGVQQHLYAVTTAGDDAEEVALTLVDTEGDSVAFDDASVVNHFALSPDSSQIVVSTDAASEDNFQLYVKTLGTNDAASMVSNVDPTSSPASGQLGPEEDSLLIWSPDGSQIAVGADWPIGADDEARTLWLMSSSSADDTRRVLGNPENDLYEVLDAAWAPSGTRLVVYGDLEDNNQASVYVLSDLTAADQAPQDVRVSDEPGTFVWVNGYDVAP